MATTVLVVAESLFDVPEWTLLCQIKSGVVNTSILDVQSCPTVTFLSVPLSQKLIQRVR